MASSQFIMFFQIFLDLVLLALLVVVFITKRPLSLKGSEELSQSLEKIIQDTAALSEQFESNLRDRRMIIQQVVSQLDFRIQEAQKVVEQLEKLQKAVKYSSPSSVPFSKQGESQQIIELAQRGLDAQAISKRLKKPIGEIELILSLQKLSSDT